ncbi:tannase/feruloyl esterase family alpha/beta hydrolase [Dyella sp. A6]|uniref:tannase/feruloyl esterase family alpha/beta hydrolase n=1 Tax=Dyella aluminiiresistens TaxID=3069105 RepID=UPI002E79D6D1|nr:tannase/feruloyl esterase family alpha/beta hydrolase [Dyella sp. A6]
MTNAKLSGATVTSATPVAAGPFTVSMQGAKTQVKMTLPAFCRVQGEASPKINFELWLPARHWNGRLLSIGSGGFGGFIDLNSLGKYLRKGYAVTVNDTGHSGNGTAWMHDSKALLAWGHDATHQVIGPAKALVRDYYGKPQTYAYFIGCSTGGAQAMEEAEFYPHDFNGIVAKSPGMDYTGLMLSFLWGLKSADDHVTIPVSKLRLLHDAVLRECDSEDGVKDGLLGDPLACRFEPESIVCKKSRHRNCLTDEEVKTAELIYQGPRDPRTGAQIYPGFVLGSEAGSATLTTAAGDSFMLNGWTLIQGLMAKQYAIPLLQNMVFGKSWDWKSFDWEHDVARVNDALGAKIDAMSPDLEPFERAGGKLIMVQGWDDPLNAATLPIQYRQDVISLFARGISRKQAANVVDGFFRLFMAPGMSHCIGGDGPSKVDALSAVVKWVEHDEPPAELLATKISMPSEKPTRPLVRRPLCPYPRYARYTKGSPDIPQSFRCVRPSVQAALN